TWEAPWSCRRSSSRRLPLPATCTAGSRRGSPPATATCSAITGRGSTWWSGRPWPADGASSSPATTSSSFRCCAGRYSLSWMRRRRRTFVPLLGCLLAAAGCVTRTTRAGRAAAPAATAVGTPDRIDRLVRQALALDAAGDRTADTLYAPEAQVVANARARFAAPRFAGVGSGGKITVAAATVTLEGRFAWAMVDYRWTSSQQNVAEAGRATFICEEKPKGWKIVHVHSSQLLPWDR